MIYKNLSTITERDKESKDAHKTINNFKEIHLLPKKMSTKIEKNEETIYECRIEQKNKFGNKKRFSLNQNRK